MDKLFVKFIWLPTENDLLYLKSIPKFTELKTLPTVLNGLKEFLNKLLNFSLTVQSYEPRINFKTSENSSSVFFAEYLLVKKRSSETHRMFYLEIPYSLLRSIIICPSNDFSVYFRLYRPSMLYAVQQHEDDNDYISYMDLTATTRWRRCVNLFKKCPNVIRKQFTMNSVLCLNFCKEDFEVLKIVLRHKNIQVHFAYMSVAPFSPVNISLEIKNFECYYEYQCLLTHSYELVDQLMVKIELEEFKKIITENVQGNSKVLSDAFYKIHSAMNKCNFVVINYSIKSLLSNSVLGDKNIFSKGDHENVKRALIIPTHVRLLPPQPILKSRALRKCNPDYSLRLTIRDVSLNAINFSFKGFTDRRKELLSEFMETHYVKKMLNGIKIGKPLYNYVGSSTSQLRGHGLWFYARDEEGLTASMLREKIGDMGKIKEVPKYMARMDQTFSQSKGHIIVPQKYTNIDSPEHDVEGGVKIYLDDFADIHKKCLKRVEETETEGEPYTFSDGIGRISLEIVEEACPNRLTPVKIGPFQSPSITPSTVLLVESRTKRLRRRPLFKF